MNTPAVEKSTFVPRIKAAVKAMAFGVIAPFLALLVLMLLLNGNLDKGSGAAAAFGAIALILVAIATVLFGTVGWGVSAALTLFGVHWPIIFLATYFLLWGILGAWQFYKM